MEPLMFPFAWCLELLRKVCYGTSWYNGIRFILGGDKLASTEGQKVLARLIRLLRVACSTCCCDIAGRGCTRELRFRERSTLDKAPLWQKSHVPKRVAVPR